MEAVGRFSALEVARVCTRQSWGAGQVCSRRICNAVEDRHRRQWEVCCTSNSETIRILRSFRWSTSEVDWRRGDVRFVRRLHDIPDLETWLGSRGFPGFDWPDRDSRRCRPWIEDGFRMRTDRARSFRSIRSFR